MNQKGFSIFEILISIFLLSFMMLGVISITDNSIKTKDRIISEDRESLQIETAFSRISWDFSQIYSPLYFSAKFESLPSTDGQVDPAVQQIQARYSRNERFDNASSEGLPIPKFQIERDKFTFFSTSNRRKFLDSKESHFAWVQYSLDTNNEGIGRLIRKFITKDPFSSERLDWDEVKGQVLLENVDKIEWFFWDFKNRKYVDSLNLIKNGKNLIRGLKLKISYRDSMDREFEKEKTFRPLFPYFVELTKAQMQQQQNGRKTIVEDEDE